MDRAPAKEVYRMGLMFTHENGILILKKDRPPHIGWISMPLCGTWSLISRTLIDQGKAVIKFNYRIFKRAVQRNKAFYCVRMPCDAFLQNAAEEFLNLQKAHFRRISQATTWYCYSWRFVVQLHWSIRLVNSMRTAWYGIEKQLKTFHISSFLSLAIHRFFEVSSIFLLS